MVYICVYSFRETNQTKNHFKMKTLLRGICLVALIASMAFAQTIPFKSVSNSTATDTVTNTGVKLQKINTKSASVGALVQVNILKLTGTSAGVVRLFGSVDGTNFIRINKTDSLNVANVTPVQPVIFDVSPNKYPFYQVQVTGSGTSTYTVKSFLGVKK